MGVSFLACNTMGRVAIGCASFIFSGWENLLRLGLYCLARIGLFIDVDTSGRRLNGNF